MLKKPVQRKNATGLFFDIRSGRFQNNPMLRLPRFSIIGLGVALAIGLHGCVGLNKNSLMKQFDARIGQNKDRLITELGLPTRDCTPVQFGEACQWSQIGGPPFLEGPLEGTFPGDSLTYFLNSEGIVCQWRFLGAHNGTMHSTRKC